MDDLVDRLTEIGLTEYQSRAYVAAVSLESASLPDLASEADIPQQRIYDVVDDLQREGLVEVYESEGGKRATAVPPEESLNELKRQRMEDFESSVDAVIGELRGQFGQVDPSTGHVTVVNHDRSIRRHVRTAIDRAEWWLFCSLPLEWVERFEDDVREAVERGVTVRLLVQGDERTALEETTYPEGVIVRHRPSADLVVAADREYAVFRGVRADVVDRPSLVTRDPSLVTMFQRYSEQFWTGSQSIQHEHPFPRRYLEPWRAHTDHEDLLAAGETLEVFVEGTETETGSAGTWTGQIADYEFEVDRDADYSVVLPEVAQLVVDTGSETVTVGGWDATLEDVAASGLEIRRP